MNDRDKDISPARSMNLTMDRLWTRMYGEPIFICEGDVIAAVSLDHGGVCTIDEAGMLSEWKSSGQLLRRKFLSDLETIWAFSDNGRLLASGNDDLILWDVESGRLQGRIPQQTWLTALHFSPDTHQIAVGQDNGSIVIWDVASQQRLVELPGHREAISALQFSPGGQYLASAAEDRLIRIWDLQSNQLHLELRSHTDRIPSLTWSPDGQILVSAGWDRSARVWRWGETEPAMLLNSHADQVHVVRFSPTGEFLAVADSDNHIYLWADPLSARLAHILSGHVEEIQTLTWAGDDRLYSAGLDRVIHLWEARSGKLQLGSNPHAPHQVAILEAEESILASTTGGRVRYWSVTTGQELTPSIEENAHTLAVDPGNHYLAIGGTDHVTRLYDLKDRNAPPRLLEATKPPIGSLAFSHDGKLLAQSSPADGLVWLWNTETEQPELILIEAADGCTLEDVAVHPNGQWVAVGGVDYLATGDRDGAVAIWDRQNKQKIFTFDQGVYCLNFDPAGRYLAAAGLDDSIYLWDMQNLDEPLRLLGHSARIRAVVFSDDGSYVLSAGDDQTLRLWDVLSGRLLGIREYDWPIMSLTLGLGGSMIFTGNGNLTCMSVALQDLLEG